ncbi:hypothetical protein BABINDRAFT_67290 [Babjeviella inositovora NRRL Y-12698]|uniref:low-specificity L-threonine aldolase n=1 Tax=Babjeviella inositovora NRRL Y-12698 TaxID=984486 RepID=A0A1E3QKL6_9ASCO|nr:uncharacterized protein BABINDRAFT_67290 [Babjeviella inositovora NRRL Y-12698]ODQ77537.1 hypothetical protein BABINDRAFT_67290 [Babjeviella inositovora NRRL Y-12698]
MPFTKTRAHNEFRSDTFTVPTPSVLAAGMASTTTLGDAVYNEDQTTLALEAKVAAITGKESGLFAVSGTLSNQIAIRTHLLQPPHSVLCDHRSHIYIDEAGGLATLSQAMVSPVRPTNGIYVTLEDLIENYIPDHGDIHLAPTKVVSLENTCNGIVMPLDEIKRISAWCKEEGLKLHLDGARLWNAHVATGISMREYCSYFDSISLCLSKSLGAPVGSVLVGTKQFTCKANHFKKQNGGGIRQSGILTAMASVAIDENLPQLAVAQAYAKDMERFLEQHQIALEWPVHTNFVFIDTKKMKMSTDLLEELGKKYDVNLMGNRIAFHFQNSPEAVENVKKAVLECYQDSLTNPYDVRGALRTYKIDN